MTLIERASKEDKTDAKIIKERKIKKVVIEKKKKIE